MAYRDLQIQASDEGGTLSPALFFHRKQKITDY